MEHSAPVKVLSSIGRSLLIICVIITYLLITRYTSVQALSLNNTSSTVPSSSCTNEGFYFDGADRYNTGWGASASIGDWQYGGVCYAEAAWSLIDQYNDQCGLGQSGYAKLASWSTNTTYYFYEVEPSTCQYGPILYDTLTKGWGSVDTFVTYYNSSNGAVEPLINGTVVAYFYPDWSANDQQWMSETQSNQDYVTGGTRHHTGFGALSYLQNGVWHNITASQYMTNNTYAGSYSTTSGNEFFTWDKRVS